jgi:[acyl-carrier-protein] S-malonyltransferase
MQLRAVFLCPGQASQCVGMGRAFYDRSPVARRHFERADEILGIPLTTLCFSGPEEELRRTENAQPALFTVGAVTCALLRERGVRPIAAAGHSVGEYTALVVAEAITFEDGLRAVRRRGELMAEQAARTPGTMAAIVGLPVPMIEEACAAAGAHGHVEIANENGPRQTVISGDVAAVAFVLDLVDGKEGALALPLNVAGAFHSRLMAPVAAEMAEVLAATLIRAPRIPVVANVTADYVRSPAEIRDALVRQIAGRVRWGASLLRLVATGADTLIDVGPGRVLTRLAREIVSNVAVRSADDVLAALEPNHERQATP